MILIEVRVTNFRSVEDSGTFKMDQVTCLVGKNEAGKSAVLQALAALNPHPATPMVLDLERDYPRRFLTQYSERHKDGDATAITTVWKLSDVELKEIEGEFGPPASSPADSRGNIRRVRCRLQASRASPGRHALSSCFYPQSLV